MLSQGLVQQPHGEATRGDNLASLPASLLSSLLQSYALVQLVQLRLVSILKHVVRVCPRDTVRMRRDICPPPVSPALSWFVLMSQNSVLLHSAGATCSRCLQGIRSLSPPVLKKWIFSPYAGAPPEVENALNHGSSACVPSGMAVCICGRFVHSSHLLRVLRGLFYCLHCGHMASSRLHCLADPMSV